MPTGVANAGTLHASASIAESPNPSACDGTSTALAALIQSGHVGGRDVAHGEQRGPGGGLLGAVEALQGARRVVREQQVAPARVEPEPLARLGARDRPEALEVDADGQHRHAAARPGAAQQPAELARDGRGQRGEGQDRAREAVRARMEEVVAVQRDHDRAEARGDRRPRGQPEVGVDDVEARAAVAAAQLAGRRG